MRIPQQPTGSYVISCSTLDDDGQNLDIRSPYTVTVRNGAGTIVATATPTHHDHVLEASIAVGLMPLLDTYTATWTGTLSGAPWSGTTTVELVGGVLFTVAQLRAFDRTFTDATKWPSDAIRTARDWVQDTMESSTAANVAFVPRARRVTLDGNGRSELVLPNFEISSVLSCSISGQAMTVQQLAALVIDDDRVWRSGWWPAGRRNVSMHYLHGRAQVPGPVQRAAMILAREYLAKSDLPGRATATSLGDQMFRLTIAGRDGVTGLPEVDAVLDQHGRKRFTVA